MEYDIFENLITKSNEVIKKGWYECPSHNTGNVGLLFERLIGLSNHNCSTPDYNGIEIKTKVINSIPIIKLFSATPDSHFSKIKNLYKAYSYYDSTNSNFKVFNKSFYSNTKTKINKNIYGELYVDRKKQHVILKFLNTETQKIDSSTSWSFKLLKEKMENKLKFLFVVYAKWKRTNNKSHCKYLRYEYFIYKDFDSFLCAIENGYIRVSFNIGIFKTGKRYGQIHDHGTSFDININHIDKVFNQCKKNIH